MLENSYHGIDPKPLSAARDYFEATVVIFVGLLVGPGLVLSIMWAIGCLP